MFEGFGRCSKDFEHLPNPLNILRIRTFSKVKRNNGFKERRERRKRKERDSGESEESDEDEDNGEDDDEDDKKVLERFRK